MDQIVNKEDIDQLFRLDNIFEEIHTQFGAPPNWSRVQGFITLSRIILEQQVSLQSAKGHFNKLNNYLSEFTPQEIIKLSGEEMKKCQISRQKSTYLQALSSSILDGSIDLNKLSEMTVTEVRTTLKTMKGIGDWTADIYLIFALQSKDIFPIGDLAVIKAIKELTNLITKDEILSCSEKWKPYRSLATFYFWHYYLKKRNRSSIA